MPWDSVQQAHWGHSPAGLKALGGKEKVAEWDAATPKGSLKKASGGPVMLANKGYQSANLKLAAGGPVLPRSTDWAKVTPDLPDRADEFTGGRKPVKMSAPAPQEYGRKGAPAVRTGDKSLPAVKPRS
jgi:hypothetical protein